MAYDFSAFDARAADVVGWLQKEFASVRTGRATPTLLDGVQVESYGVNVPLQQVGSVGIEDARTLRVTPWDQSGIQSIEKAINEANLGVSVVTDEKGLRVIFPELTSERREQLLKLAKTKLEDARVSLRQARDEVAREVDAQIKTADISKDDGFRAKEELQKRVDKKNEELAAMLDRKEKEINA